jgi:hypothetical protein
MSFGDASAWFINPEVAIYRDLAKEMREKSRELVAGLSKKVSRRNVDDVYEDSEGGV